MYRAVCRDSWKTSANVYQLYHVCCHAMTCYQARRSSSWVWDICFHHSCFSVFFVSLHHSSFQKSINIISFPVPFFQVFQIVVTSCHSMRRGAKAQEALNSLVLERKLKFLRNAASSADQERQDIARCSQLPDARVTLKIHRITSIHRNTTSVCRHPNKPNKNHSAS